MKFVKLNYHDADASYFRKKSDMVYLNVKIQIIFSGAFLASLSFMSTIFSNLLFRFASLLSALSCYLHPPYEFIMIKKAYTSPQMGSRWAQFYKTHGFSSLQIST
jgi:hypothetical protein